MVLHEVAPIESSPLRLEDVETPKVGPGEVLIKVSACGVCRSNLHMIEGDLLRDEHVPSRLPLIPGHEVTGMIEEAGKEVTTLSVGDKVGVQPLYNTCGKCELCMTGHENLCPNSQWTGQTVDGGYAQYMKAIGAHVYRVPTGLDMAEAAPLFCPGLTAYSAVRKMEPYAGKKVAVFGIGGVGHMSVQYARVSGCTVVAVDREPDHLALAEEIGADETVSSLEKDALSTIGQVDASVVHAPSDEYISMAAEVTKRGGIVVVGAMGGIAKFPFTKEVVVKGSLIGTRADMENVLKIASKGLVRAKVDRFNLTKANDVLLSMKRDRIRGRAVLVP